MAASFVVGGIVVDAVVVAGGNGLIGESVSIGTSGFGSKDGLGDKVVVTLGDWVTTLSDKLDVVDVNGLGVVGTFDVGSGTFSVIWHSIDVGWVFTIIEKSGSTYFHFSILKASIKIKGFKAYPIVSSLLIDCLQGRMLLQ